MVMAYLGVINVLNELMFSYTNAGAANAQLLLVTCLKRKTL